MGARENVTRFAFPTTAPTSGQAGYEILPAITGANLRSLRRLRLTLRSSHDAAASGLSFQCNLEGDGTTYRLWTAYSHLAATATNPQWLYDVEVPPGVLGVKILYTNSASVLTSWAGAIVGVYDETAAP